VPRQAFIELKTSNAACPSKFRFTLAGQYLLIEASHGGLSKAKKHSFPKGK
jgi:hypothetical protein